MTTFKVTFFENNEIFKVETYHNVVNQFFFAENIAILIDTLELDEEVHVYDENGKSWSDSVNGIVGLMLKEMRNYPIDLTKPTRKPKNTYKVNRRNK